MILQPNSYSFLTTSSTHYFKQFNFLSYHPTKS